MTFAECSRPRRAGESFGRCGHCPECKGVRAELYRLFDLGMGPKKAAKHTGLSPQKTRAYREKWRWWIMKKPQAGADEPTGPRVRCECGLTVDRDHTSETCDMRVTRSTGMGQWGFSYGG